MNYSKEITEVHQEFNTAADKLLEEAKGFLATVQVNNEEKISLLGKFGFTRTPEFVRESVKTTQISFRTRQAELIEYYKTTYPNYKFIQEPQVKEICSKYGLICGSISRYQGFVPIKNLKEIEKFKGAKVEDRLYKRYTGFNNEVKFVGLDQLYSSDENYADPVTIKDSLICAPEKDFDTRGHEISDDYRLTEKSVPDPVVLFPVREGYLIITAWGDEASDPLVVNETFN